MKRRLQSLMILLLLIAIPQANAEEDPPHFTHGPVLGRLSNSGIGVWARTSRSTEFQVRYGLSADKMDQITDAVPTQLEHDNTGWVLITGLTPNTRGAPVRADDQPAGTLVRGPAVLVSNARFRAHRPQQ